MLIDCFVVCCVDCQTERGITGGLTSGKLLTVFLAAITNDNVGQVESSHSGYKYRSDSLLDLTSFRLNINRWLTATLTRHRRDEL
jgi:hypothetical protein